MALDPTTDLPRSRTTVKLYLADSVLFTDLQQHQAFHFLSQEQISRTNGMSDKRKREYLVTRWLLRTVLIRHLQLDQKIEIVMADREGLPPAIPLASAVGLEFSISHSHGHIGIAVAMHNPVGLDLESLNHQRKFIDLSGEFCNSDERLSIEQAASSEARRRRFYEIWTQKEAFLKLKQLGIGSTSLPSIHFSEQANPQLPQMAEPCFAASGNIDQLQICIASWKPLVIDVTEVGITADRHKGILPTRQFVFQATGKGKSSARLETV